MPSTAPHHGTGDRDPRTLTRWRRCVVCLPGGRGGLLCNDGTGQYSDALLCDISVACKHTFFVCTVSHLKCPSTETGDPQPPGSAQVHGRGGRGLQKKLTWRQRSSVCRSSRQLESRFIVCLPGSRGGLLRNGRSGKCSHVVQTDIGIPCRHTLLSPISA